MGKYILKRLLHLIPVLLGLTFISFLLIYISPGDAATKKLTANGVAVSKEVIEQARASMGLDRPFLVQYGDWLSHILVGDFGVSYKDGLPVLNKLLFGLSNTFVLASISLGIAIVLSVPLGIISAVFKGRLIEKVLNLLFFVTNALTNFLIATILIYLFCVKYKLFPIVAKGDINGLILPAISLAIPITGRFMRQIKTEVLAEFGKPYVKGLASKGVLKRYIIFTNVLRNALPAIITLVALSFATLLGGAVVTEVVFNWKGIGHVVMSAILMRDYPIIQGFVLIMGVINVVINLFSDISHKLLDYRVEL